MSVALSFSVHMILFVLCRVTVDLFDTPGTSICSGPVWRSGKPLVCHRCGPGLIPGVGIW